MIGVSMKSLYERMPWSSLVSTAFSQLSILRARIFVKREIVSVIVVESTLKRKYAKLSPIATSRAGKLVMPRDQRKAATGRSLSLCSLKS